MGGDKIWKVIERACIVLGALGGVASGVFAALAYLQPLSAPVPTPPHSLAPLVRPHVAGSGIVSTLPPWGLWTFLGAAILLMLTGWAMIVLRLRSERAAPTRTAVIGSVATNPQRTRPLYEPPPAATTLPTPPLKTPSTKNPILEVLKCEWTDAREGQHRVSSFLTLTIVNKSPMTLSECYIQIETIAHKDHLLTIDRPLSADLATKLRFTVQVNGLARVYLTRRNLKDVVTLPPHLIPLTDQARINLDDGQVYTVTVSVRCASPIVTFAKIKIVGDGEKIEGEIIDQWAAE